MNLSKPFNVVLVDDHILLRDALAVVINGFNEFSVTGVAGNGAEFLKLIENSIEPDLVLMDLSMPVMDGYETTKWLQQNYPQVRTLILTMYDSEVALIRLLQMGVRGFLKKDIHPTELRSALLSVAENGYYYSHNATGKLASFFHRNHTSQTSIEKALLNETEISFLKMASTDLTYKEIAQKMNMTPRAIDGHRDALFDKLDVKSRVGLAIYAVKHGIVTF